MLPSAPKARRSAGSHFHSYRGLAAGLLGLLLAGCSGGGTDPAGLTTPPPPAPDIGSDWKPGAVGAALEIEPVIDVRNNYGGARAETILASVPFPEGMVSDLSSVGISGHGTAWMPLQHWPDGSVRIAQAQFTAELEPSSNTKYRVVKDVEALSGPFERNVWVDMLDQDMRIKVRVRDTHNAAYEAEVTPLEGRVVHATPLVRTTHHRVFHQPVGGNSIGRDYLSSQFYVREYRDIPVVIVDWVIGNDYLGADDPGGSEDPDLHPLGGVDVNEASILFAGQKAVWAYRAGWHGIGNPVGESGYQRFQVMSNTYINDGQTRRYRFFLKCEPPGAGTEEAARWHATFEAMAGAPLFPLAEQDTWQRSAGLGLHGGPISAGSDAKSRAQAEWNTWSGRDHFGTWGSFGDTLNSGTAGTPRNTPVSPDLTHAIQANFPSLLQILEQKAWAQACRPYHLYGLEVGAEQKILLYDGLPFTVTSGDPTVECLGRRRIWNDNPYASVRTRSAQKSNGWNAYDENHWSTDLLFDYWTVTGDHWAREEMRNRGQSLEGMLRLQHFATANVRCGRCEGWSMVGFVQAYLATGDESIKQFALRRIEEVVEVQRRKDHPGLFMKEMGPDPRSGMGDDVKFYPQWEHGSVMFGYLGAYKYFGSDTALQIAEDVIRGIEYSWISDYTHPVTGTFYPHAVRYWTPTSKAGNVIPAQTFDNDPSRGAYIPSGGGIRSVNSMLVGGIYLVAQYTSDPDIGNRALWQGQRLLPTPLSDNDRWDKWYSVYPPDYEAKRRGVE